MGFPFSHQHSHIQLSEKKERELKIYDSGRWRVYLSSCVALVEEWFCSKN